MEYLDLRRIDGSVTGEKKERSSVHRDGDLHGTSHVWLYRKKNGRYEILLQKRSQNKDSFPGCYDISSAGHIPAGEDYLSSAVRELYEELGIRAKEQELAYLGMHYGVAHEEFYGVPFHNAEISAVFALEADKEPEEMRLQEEEVESVQWFCWKDCLEKIGSGELDHCIFADEFAMLSEYFHFLDEDTGEEEKKRNEG